jgi:hypothetical protein
VRVAVTSIASENLAKYNIAKPAGWKFFMMEDRVRINVWNPDVVLCVGWFCDGWGDKQAHVSNFGDTRKIIIQWIGTDILILKKAYEAGHKSILEWLKSDRFLHVAPTRDAIQEMEWTGLKFYGPIDVPAQELIDPQPMPEKIRLAVYLPPDRQHFYGIDLLKDVLPKFRECDIVFYHWLPLNGKVQYEKRREEHFALNHEEYVEKILKGCSALIRVPVHDAGSISIGEFLMAGKPVVTNQNLPKWPHSTGALYYEERGDFKTMNGAQAKLEKGIREIVDLLKNSSEPVPEKTRQYYRDMYDPKLYVKKLSEYAQDHWGCPIESAVDSDSRPVLV